MAVVLDVVVVVAADDAATLHTTATTTIVELLRPLPLRENASQVRRRQARCLCCR